MQFGLVYWHPRIYAFFMRVRYGANYDIRYKKVAEAVGTLGVLDVCCGDAKIASYLPDAKKYRGVDFHPGFVEHGKKLGLKVSRADVWLDDISRAECILMQGSLYHFYPSHRDVLRRLLKAATVKTIISEPIHNLSSSSNALVRGLARLITKTASGSHPKRFSKEEILALAKEFRADSVREAGSDMILSFNVRARSLV